MIKDQGISSLVIILLILITFSLDDVWISSGENFSWSPMGMEARSGQNHDNKIAPHVNFNTTAANIMDMLCIFFITKQYFFQRVNNYF